MEVRCKCGFVVKCFSLLFGTAVFKCSRLCERSVLQEWISVVKKLLCQYEIELRTSFAHCRGHSRTDSRLLIRIAQMFFWRKFTFLISAYSVFSCGGRIKLTVLHIILLHCCFPSTLGWNPGCLHRDLDLLHTHAHTYIHIHTHTYTYINMRTAGK